LDHRLARIEGHVRAVRRMVAERRAADEILLQIAAVQGGLSSVMS
ncbi:MAG: metal-sensing transcriptional repressor, partial [Gammaproteobacteria bacterium]|nr:metal-sensing transcriptional repressor [Gammaproteobacteria bacterium]